MPCSAAKIPIQPAHIQHITPRPAVIFQPVPPRDPRGITPSSGSGWQTANPFPKNFGTKSVFHLPTAKTVRYLFYVYQIMYHTAGSSYQGLSSEMVLRALSALALTVDVAEIKRLLKNISCFFSTTTKSYK